MDENAVKLQCEEKMDDRLTPAQREYIIRAVMSLVKDPHRKGLIEELEKRIEDKLTEELSDEEKEEVEIERIIWAVAASVDDAVEQMNSPEES